MFSLGDAKMQNSIILVLYAESSKNSAKIIPECIMKLLLLFAALHIKMSQVVLTMEYSLCTYSIFTQLILHRLQFFGQSYIHIVRILMQYTHIYVICFVKTYAHYVKEQFSLSMDSSSNKLTNCQ